MNQTLLELLMKSDVWQPVAAIQQEAENLRKDHLYQMCYFSSLWILIIVPFKCISSATDTARVYFSIVMWKAKRQKKAIIIGKPVKLICCLTLVL